MNSPQEHIEIVKKIDSYIKGELNSNQVDDLWIEFAKNPEWLSYLETEIALRGIYEKGSTLKSGSVFHVIKTNIWHMAAAAAILIVGMIQLLNIGPSGAGVFTLSEIPETEMEFYDALRDTNGNQQISTADSLLNVGFNAAYRKKYDEALAIFNQILEVAPFEPYLSKSELNKGIIFYNQSNFSEAVTSFRIAGEGSSENRMVQEKAYWYLTHSLLNLKRYAEAQQSAIQTYGLEGVYQNEALNIARKIDLLMESAPPAKSNE